MSDYPIIPRARKVRLEVLFEDNHILAVQKPAGMPVQGDETGDLSVVEWAEEYIRYKYKKPGNVYAGLVHRIDRPVAGVVLIAKTSKAASRLSEMFRERLIYKTYLAVLSRKPEPVEAVLKHYIWKDQNDNRAYCYVKEKTGSKFAELSYRLLDSSENCYLVEVKPVTGRPHQIRAQLSAIKCPILGDTKYGSQMPMRDRSICLLAWKISFEHPVSKKPVTITAEFPKQKFWQMFQI